MTEYTDLYLCFDSADQTLQVARALSNNPDVTELPPDGWHNGVYYNILVIGTLYEPQDDPESPPVALPGYHVNARWRSSAETIPEVVRPFMTFPSTPRVVWG